MLKPKLDHIGIAVENLDAAIQSYETLGFAVESIEDVPGFGVKVAFLPMESGSLELVQRDRIVCRFLHCIENVLSDYRSAVARHRARHVDDRSDSILLVDVH